MFPPLPPPTLPAPHHAQQTQRHVPSYVQAVMRVPPPAWQAQYASFVAAPLPPPRRQPFVPRNGFVVNVPRRAMKNEQPRGPVARYSTAVVQPPLPTKPCNQSDKENQSPFEHQQQAEKKCKEMSSSKPTIPEAVMIKTTVSKPIWPDPSPREKLSSLPTETKSIWAVTQLDLTTMMLQARREKAAAQRAQSLQLKKPARSNQETHEWDQKSDSSSAEGSDTDTEDEDFPVLKKCCGFPFLVEFPCDGQDTERLSSTIPVGEQNHQHVEDIQWQESPVFLRQNRAAVLDYRKLFSSVPTSAPPSYSPSDMPSFSEDGTTPPHMLWWPGDWKCSTCGNHVRFDEAAGYFFGLTGFLDCLVQFKNFSYRELCKRCREGRYHEAGFVYPLQP